MSDNTNKQIAGIIKRLERLEKEILPKGKSLVAPIKSKESDFTGPKGGILFLISKNFFSKKRGARQVLDELEKNDYIGYRIQVVQTALNRLSKPKGPLTALTDNGVKVYAKRK